MEKQINCQFKDCINYSIDGIPFYKDCYFCSRNDGDSEHIKDCYQSREFIEKLKERRSL